MNVCSLELDLWEDVLMCRVVDPWFNFRATKYLVKHGFYAFWDWFDDREFPQYSGK